VYVWRMDIAGFNLNVNTLSIIIVGVKYLKRKINVLYVEQLQMSRL